MGIYGNLSNIKKEQMEHLKALQNSVYPKRDIVSQELALQLASLTESIGREIAVYLDRYGRIRDVMVGDQDTVPLLKAHLRRNFARLAGLRCIHTHPSGNSTLSEIDLSSLQEYKLDAIVAIGAGSEKNLKISVAFLQPGDDYKYTVKLIEPMGLKELENFCFWDILQEIDKKSKNSSLFVEKTKEEKTLLIGFKGAKEKLITGEESLEELRALAETAGADVKQQIMIKLIKPDPSFYLGRGKAKDFSLYIQQEAIDLIIFDDELSPRQQNNLEDLLGCRVIDRTALILQIFANRAKTKEGQLQVELAQLNYLLPRMRGRGIELSRLGGGIGTRGPGETKLETDKRYIRKRISELQNKIEEIKKQRQIIRQKRSQNQIPVVALIGYTNAGKSTILNTLTNANALAEDKLFATLDPTTRKLKLNQEDILLTDTVGFIHKLPHQLVAAFRATLEEIKYADLLLHVVDAANSACLSHIETVNQVLKELDCLAKPTIMVFNKWDLIKDAVEMNCILKQEHPAIPVSAVKNFNLIKLMSLIGNNLPQRVKLVELMLPFNKNFLINLLYEEGKVIKTEYREEGIFCSVYLTDRFINQVQEYLL